MTRTRSRWLLTAGWLFAAGSAVHVVDHLRRGQGSVSDELYWLGNVALVVQVVVVTLVVTRHRRAPHLAAAAGFPLAAGFFAAHWFPTWSALSDPVWEVSSMRWFTYAASTAEIIGALAVGLAGMLVLRERTSTTVDDPHDTVAATPV